MYKNYIFDLYGTLLDIHTDIWKESFWQSIAEKIQEYGVHEEAEELRRKYNTLCRRENDLMNDRPYPEIDIYRVFAQMLPVGTSREDIIRFACEFRTISREVIALYPHTLETLDKLKERGCRLYLLSNAQHIFTMPELEMFGLPAYFERIMISSDHQMRKPDPEFLKTLLREEELDVSQCVMVGNEFESDIAVAKACGMDAIYLNTGGLSDFDLARSAQPRVRIIESGDIREILDEANMPDWLKDAVFYEIYPPSFCDSNHDGIGDIPGIISKLDYFRELGCNALWLNPCFDSPFLDGGYDVRDYRKTAERYGTNEDLVHLFDEAHKRGIRVFLDLVPGHTSDQHPWFLESKKAEPNAYSGRYIWTSHAFEGIAGRPYISGMSDRAGAYMLNFFASQPALNYGWLNRTAPWQSAPDSPEAVETKEAVKDIMRFWMDLGCDGFRVDMADSLVKNDDENKSATAAIWRDIRKMMDREYPDCALVSEWSNPEQAIVRGGFHMDFYLDHHYNGYNTLLRDYETEGGDHSYFRCAGHGNIRRFLDDYLPKYERSRKAGYISMFTCNHDTPRPARTLSTEELKLAYAMIFTMPGVPFVYYGDEIGMDYLDVPTKEGGYQRTGSRTPMQWDHSKNMGFSDADEIYLPQETDGPAVSDQKDDPESLWNTLRNIIALRHQYRSLQADAPFVVLCGEKDMPFIYQRNELIIAVNPSSRTITVPHALWKNTHKIFSIRDSETGPDQLTMGPQSFVILERQE